MVYTVLLMLLPPAFVLKVNIREQKDNLFLAPPSYITLHTYSHKYIMYLARTIMHYIDVHTRYLQSHFLSYIRTFYGMMIYKSWLISVSIKIWICKNKLIGWYIKHWSFGLSFPCFSCFAWNIWFRLIWLMKLA